MTYKLKTYQDVEREYLRQFDRCAEFRKDNAKRHFHEVFDKLFYANRTDTDEDVLQFLRTEADSRGLWMASRPYEFPE